MFALCPSVWLSLYSAQDMAPLSVLEASGRGRPRGSPSAYGFGPTKVHPILSPDKLGQASSEVSLLTAPGHPQATVPNPQPGSKRNASKGKTP